MRNAFPALLVLCCFLVPAAAGAEEPVPTPSGLEKEISSLKVDEVGWRDIAWKSCLLEGLAEAKRKHRPVILWIFIDRPQDDERC